MWYPCIIVDHESWRPAWARTLLIDGRAVVTTRPDDGPRWLTGLEWPVPEGPASQVMIETAAKGFAVVVRDSRSR